MKKLILNLSLVLALFLGIIAVNTSVYATDFYENGKLVKSCNHPSVTITKYIKGTEKNDGRKEETCNICGSNFRTTSWNKIGSVSLNKTSFTYNGFSQYPIVIVKDSEGYGISSDNYTITYEKGGKKVSSPCDVGKYNLKITFKNKYEGVINKSFKITKKQAKKSNLLIENVTYTGKATKPKTIYFKASSLATAIPLKKDVDYKIIKVSNNKKFGTANVTLKLIGNLKGTIKTTYKITPGKVSKIKLENRDTSSINVSWKKVKNATGYKIYRYNTKKNKYELYATTKSTSAKIKMPSKDMPYIDLEIASYKKIGNKNYISERVYYWNCTKPEKINKYSVSSPSKGNIKVKYKLEKNTYKNIQIQICEDKSFNSKKAKVKNFYNWVGSDSQNNYYRISKLTSKKTYYIRTRELNQDINGKNIYGDWGKVLKVRVK